MSDSPLVYAPPQALRAMIANNKIGYQYFIAFIYSHSSNVKPPKHQCHETTWHKNLYVLSFCNEHARCALDSELLKTRMIASVSCKGATNYCRRSRYLAARLREIRQEPPIDTGGQCFDICLKGFYNEKRCSLLATISMTLVRGATSCLMSFASPAALREEIAPPQLYARR
jgi:hypothetical protein